MEVEEESPLQCGGKEAQNMNQLAFDVLQNWCFLGQFVKKVYCQKMWDFLKELCMFHSI
jgi:hypothetical protein